MGLTDKISRSIKNPKKTLVRNMNKVDDMAGKKLFGNTVGLKRNVAGGLQKGNIQKDLKDKNPKAYDLVQNQFLLLNKIFDDETIKAIKSKFDSLIENEELSVPTSHYDGKVYSRHIKNPEKNIPELKNLLTEEIYDIIKGYYGKDFSVKHVNCFRNYHIPPEISSSQEIFAEHWHCDRRNISEMKLFVCLSSVTEDDGPFHVQSQDRTQYLMNKGFGTREDYNIQNEVLEDPTFVKKAIGPAGTAYFGNANLCLHKAGIPTVGHSRDLVNFVFVPSNKPLSDNWEENVVDTLDKYKNPNF